MRVPGLSRSVFFVIQRLAAVLIQYRRVTDTHAHRIRTRARTHYTTAYTALAAGVTSRAKNVFMLFIFL